MAGFQTRHLRAVPQPHQTASEQRYYAKFNHWLTTLHLANGINRQERATKDLVKAAREIGNEEAAMCLETAEAALIDARLELRR